MTPELCPCASGKPYTTCCAPYLIGHAKPVLPEQLMRSRYTAFQQGNVDYLIATHHPSQRKADDRKLLTESSHDTEWLGLRVLKSDESQIAAGVGTVEFAAFYKFNDSIAQMHEKSEFIYQNGRWYYMQGVTLEPIKINRNDPCWCGSGKKYKQCHG